MGYIIGYGSIAILMLIMVIICVVLLTLAGIEIQKREHLNNEAKLGYDLLVTAICLSYAVVIIYLALIIYSWSNENNPLSVLSGMANKNTIACLIGMIVIAFLYTVITCYATYYISFDSGSTQSYNYLISSSVLLAVTTALGIGGAVYVGTYKENVLKELLGNKIN